MDIMDITGTVNAGNRAAASREQGYNGTEGDLKIVLYVPSPGRLRTLDKSALDVWVALCSFARWDRGFRRGVCSPSLPELADAALVCCRTASKGLRLLEDAGLIEVRRVMSGGRILGTRYTLLAA